MTRDISGAFRSATPDDDPASWLDLAEGIRKRGQRIDRLEEQLRDKSFDEWDPKLQKYVVKGDFVTEASLQTTYEDRLKRLRREQAKEVRDLADGHGPDHVHPLATPEKD